MAFRVESEAYVHAREKIVWLGVNGTLLVSCAVKHLLTSLRLLVRVVAQKYFKYFPWGSLLLPWFASGRRILPAVRLQALRALEKEKKKGSENERCFYFVFLCYSEIWVYRRIYKMYNNKMTIKMPINTSPNYCSSSSVNRKALIKSNWFTSQSSCI